MIVVGILAGLVFPTMATAALLRLALPVVWMSSRTLAISVAIIVGLGCSSLLFAAGVFTFGAQWRAFVPLEIALWVVAFALCRVLARQRTFTAPTSTRSPWLVRAAALGFASTLVLSLLHFYVVTANYPSGTWDAWAIWNLRARFLHRGLEGHWRDAFQAALGWSHPNYPLMLPSNVARLWLYAGGESSVAPVTLAFLFQYSAVGILVGGLQAMGRRLEAYVAGGVLLASYPFNLWGVGQISDVPVATFVLAATVLLVWIIDKRERTDGPAAAFLTFCAACAAWTKNEGQVFALAICVILALLIVVRRRLIFATMIFSMAGLLVPLGVLFYFKSSLAPPSYLFQGFAGNKPPPQLWDLERHKFILYSFGRELWAWTTANPIGIIPFVVAYGVAAPAIRGLRYAHLTPTVPLIAMLAGYYGAYVVTPLDLKWHVEYSLSRLILQIWPATVFVVFCLAARPMAADA